jgi:hypothetical protein
MKLSNTHEIVIAIVFALIVAALIVLASNLVCASSPKQADFPPREDFPRAYETVKVLRYEDTVCFKCHN